MGRSEEYCRDGRYADMLALFEEAKLARDFERGEQALIKALSYGPGDEYVWRSLAWCQLNEGKWQESLAVANENVVRNGECAWSLSQLYDSQLAAGDYRDAAATLARAVSLRNWQGIDLQKTSADYTARTSQRTFSLEIEIVPAENVADRRFEFLIPTNCERQRFEDRIVTGGDEPLFFSRDGRDFLAVTVHAGQRATLSGKLVLEPVLIGPRVLEQAGRNAGAELASYLGPFVHGGRQNRYDPNLPQLKDVSQTLEGPNSAARIRSVLLWLKRNFRYEPLPTDDLPGILAARHGVCHHYCGLFCAMARAQGVPSRILHVTALPDFKLDEAKTINQKGAATSAHGQDEVWVGTPGWVPLEPQRADSFGGYLNNVILFNRSGNGEADDNWKLRSLSASPMKLRLIAVRQRLSEVQ